MEDFFNHFVRVQDLISRKTRDLTAAEMRGNRHDEKGKLQNLFVDCFDHHTDYLNGPRVDKLTYAPDEESRRFIPRDEIIARYLDHYYLPPTIVNGYWDDGEELTGDASLSFNELCQQLMSFPITADVTKEARLGSNNYSYIIGDVGAGKSALVSAAYRKILHSPLDKHGYRVIPIYVNVDPKKDANSDLPPIDNQWFDKEFEKIVDQIKDLPDELTKIAGLNQFLVDVGDSYRAKFRKLARHLAVRKVRLVIYLDNIDRYHFHYSRHRFTKEYGTEQRQSVVNNLANLIEVFSSPDHLGWCGFCVVIVCRRYVYQYLRSACDDQAKVDREYGSLFSVLLEDPYQAISSRMNLFGEAVNEVLKAKPNLPAEHYQEALHSFFFIDSIGEELRPEILLINRLGHHSLRSLIGFIDGLKLDVSDREVFTRLLKKQPNILSVLYLLKLHRRYSQNVGHFPNIFLVDSQASKTDRYAAAHLPHRPTYWLKYFLLKYISKYESRKFSQLERLFVKIGGFEDHIFRLALGSLMSTNESRCIDADPGSEMNGMADVELFITNRGRRIVEPIVEYGADVDFCFEFSYLQLIIDDAWLSLPIIDAPNVVSELDYKYLFEADKVYGEKAAEMVAKKAKSVLTFFRVLEASLLFEERHRHTFFDVMRKIDAVPSMDKVHSSLVRSIANIESGMSSKVKSDLPASLRNRHDEACSNRLKDFFETVHRLGVVVQS